MNSLKIYIFDNWNEYYVHIYSKTALYTITLPAFSHSPTIQFELLHSKYHLCCIATRQLLLSTYVKFMNLFPEIKDKIQTVYVHTCSSFNLNTVILLELWGDVDDLFYIIYIINYIIRKIVFKILYCSILYQYY